MFKKFTLHRTPSHLTQNTIKTLKPVMREPLMVRNNLLIMKHNVYRLRSLVKIHYLIYSCLFTKLCLQQKQKNKQNNTHTPTPPHTPHTHNLLMLNLIYMQAQHCIDRCILSLIMLSKS